MKRLAFVDHAYHARTRSSEPVLRILRKRYRVEVFLDGVGIGWRPFDLSTLRDAGYDCVVFWQMIYDADSIRELGIENVLFVPMLDSLEHYERLGWPSYEGHKIVSFSRALDDVLRRNGLDCRPVRFFPEPPAEAASFGPPGLRGFFWQRRPRPSWNDVRRLIEGTAFESVHLHAVPDPGRTDARPARDRAEEPRCRITVTEWLPDRSDYLERLRSANVFFAPRACEGIGLACLEAMSLGMCVVAPNAPTMNEYIDNGVTGLLYDPDDPRALDFTHAPSLGAAARESVIAGHRAWKRDAEALLDYLAADA